MASTADIRNGLCIDFNHDIWQFVEFLHVKPGKGNAFFVRSKLKSLTSGKVVEHTFPSGATLNEVRWREGCISSCIRMNSVLIS